MRRAALAAAFAAALLLTGCVQWFQPPAPPESTPTGETVPAALEPYYHQVLSWSPCGNGKQCATAIAPLDWADPGGERIELALVRQVATSGGRQGSLLVNPGGPGASGKAFILDSVDFATGDRLQAAFDVVGFDPRGVGDSTAVACYEHPRELDEHLFTVVRSEPGSEEWIAAARAQAERFGAACAEHTGPLLAHVDTASAARDLDMLRAALGDQRLNYLGYSYGSLLGQQYAELFPERAGRLVLDGAVDPAATGFDLSAGQARGFERALAAFLEDCHSIRDCPFTGPVAQDQALVRTLLDTLDASPLAAEDGRQLGSATMFTAIILPLYNTSNWPMLRSLFDSVFAGEADYAFSLADSYYARNPDGGYRSNQTEAFVAINCLGPREQDDPDAMRAQAQHLAELAPVFGPQLAYGALGCAGWPHPSLREAGPITAPGSPDILVLGTSGDPATPYEWSVAVAAALANGHLVSYDGQGHTAYNKSNACVNRAVEDFLVDGTIPPADPRC